jgi:hypothetical protein
VSPATAADRRGRGSTRIRAIIGRACSSSSPAIPLSPDASRDAPTCAAVSYVVDKTGATSHVKLERVVPDGRLGKVAVDIVTVLRYGAAAENPGKDPVATYVVMPFNLPGAASTNPADQATRTRVLAACKLENFSPAPK